MTELTETYLLDDGSRRREGALICLACALLVLACVAALVWLLV